MKKLILTVLILVFSFPAFGQNINSLDTRNGFKDFKLGDKFSKWQIQLVYEETWNDGTKGYRYVGSCCNKIFDYDLQNISLRFDKNDNLVGIYLTTKRFQKEYVFSGQYTKWRKDDFESINGSLIQLFGKQTDIKADKETGNVIYTWIGKKVMMVSKYEYLGTKEGDRQIVNILDVKFLDTGVEKGF